MAYYSYLGRVNEIDSWDQHSHSTGIWISLKVGQGCGLVPLPPPP